MMSTSNAVENHITDLLPAYALDALDEQETLEVVEHLSFCTQCREELEQYREVAGELPLAAPPFDPSPALKARLMNQLRQRHGTGSAGDRAQFHAQQRGEPERSLLWRMRQALRWQRLTPAAGLAGILLIILMGASNLLLWQQVNRLTDTAQSASLQVVALNSTDAAPGASGLLVISDDGHWGTVVVNRLAALEESSQYQLWLIEDRQRTSGGVFSVLKSGYGVLEISSKRSLFEYSSFGITIEPAGGSPGPTGDKVLGGEF